MEKVQKFLMSAYVCFIALAFFLAVLFETDCLIPGLLAGDTASEFVVTMILELSTLLCAFLALRLFRFQKVSHDLYTRQAPAMLQWGMIRLMLLGIPMVADTLFYYIYMNTTFGYLAIMLLLCQPFVCPTMGRCIAETTPEA